MDFKDYYDVLGVKPDADEKTIKKAYHQLAKKYHPDVNPGDNEAEQKFKDVTEAYQAIIDPAKRKKYDDLRNNFKNWQQRGGSGGDFDWGNWQARPGEGTYSRTVSPEEFAEMFGDIGSGYGGTGGFSDFFSSIFGMGGMGSMGGNAGNTRNHTYGFGGAPRAQAGQDIESEIDITLEEAYHGTTRIIQTGEKRIEAKIPKGVRTGSKVRLSGQGGPGISGGPKGNLYLITRVLPNASYQRDGDDLTIQAPVDFYTAVLGGEISVQTLSGPVLIKIPPQTQNGKKFRLKGKGMPKLEHPQSYGYLYAEIKIVLPASLTETEIQTLKELAQQRKGKNT